jgi:CheY-like chemotaxis protein
MKATKILLVDDEEIFARNISRLLANRGYRVTAVNSGDAAIRTLEKENFDVMVLDLKMPGLDIFLGTEHFFGFGRSDQDQFIP